MMGEKIFRGLLELSLDASVLIALVLLVRLLLKRMPARFRCVLWGLAGIKLVCPFTFKTDIALPRIITGIVSPSAAAEGIENAAHAAAKVFRGTYPSVGAVSAAASAAKENAGGIGVFRLLALLWLAGAAVMLCRLMICYVKLGRKIGASYPSEERVFICTEACTPFVFGIFSPKIIIPQGLGDEVLKSVLMHERTHVRRLDFLWKPLGYALLSLHWFNPLVWAGYAAFCKDIELACDEAVISKMNSRGRADYSQALLNFGMHHYGFAAGPLGFGEIAIKERIKKVLKYKKPGAIVAISAFAVCVVLAFCFFTKADAADKLSDGPANEVREEIKEENMAENEVIPTDAKTENVGNEESPQAPREAEKLENEEPKPQEPEIGPAPATESEEREFIWPCESTRISQPFGVRVHPVSGTTTLHDHVDIAAEKGSPVFAAADGVVSETGYAAGVGNYIVIVHSAPDEEYVATKYFHLLEVTAPAEAEVKAGDVIGKIGSTGMSTGPHLAFSVVLGEEAVDPMLFFGAGEPEEGAAEEDGGFNTGVEVK